MIQSEAYPQPSPEWIKREVLSIGLRQLFGRTVARNRPIYRSRMATLGAEVYVEVLLLPSLQMVLRVCDDATSEVLTQSDPDDFTSVDVNGLHEAQLFRDWQAARTASATLVDGTPLATDHQRGPFQP